MRRPLLVVLLACAACTGTRWSTRPMAWSEASRLVAQADDLAAQNSPKGARDLYQRVLKEHPHEPAAADALWGLTQLEVNPESPLVDYRAALVNVERLLAEYPESPHKGEARAWRGVLRELQRREVETARLRGDLDRLKAMDMEQER